MESSIAPLLPLFYRERAAGNALAVGVLIATQGSTYRKPGALMLMAANGEYAGLLSGGCLESDLGERARSVIETGEACVLSYDTRSADDLIWGLGLGCEGAMQILLLRVGPDHDWQPLTHLARCHAAHDPTAVGIVVESEWVDMPLGTIGLVGSATAEQSCGGNTVAALPPRGSLSLQARAAMHEPRITALLEQTAHSGHLGWFEGAAPRWKLLALPLSLPPKLLLLGAGPDAVPIVELAARLNWKVTLIDHRPAYADISRFPSAERVVSARPDESFETVDPNDFSAAVVMSHHLPSDLMYLRVLGATAIPYVGLLGPAPRREKLLAQLGQTAVELRSRLHAPVGLPLGGRSPESVALAIVAQIHAFVFGADRSRTERDDGCSGPGPALAAMGGR